MNAAAEENLKRAMELAQWMVKLADDGEASSADDGCAVLYGVIRDSAYEIKSRAEREQDAHRGDMGR